MIRTGRWISQTFLVHYLDFYFILFRSHYISVSKVMIKLNDSNWAFWKLRMKDILYAENLPSPIEGDEARPKGISDEEWYILNRKAVAKIRQCLDDNVINFVAQETNARQLWLTLESLFWKKTISKKLSILKGLKSLKYKEGVSVSEHLGDFAELLLELSAMDIEFQDEVKALLLLNTLPDSWGTFAGVVCTCAPNGVLTMEFVKSKTFDEETRREIADYDRNLGRDYRGRNTSRGPRSQSRSRGRSQVKDRRRCYHCGKQGHIRRNCRVWLTEQKRGP